MDWSALFGTGGSLESVNLLAGLDGAKDVLPFVIVPFLGWTAFKIGKRMIAKSTKGKL